MFVKYLSLLMLMFSAVCHADESPDRPSPTPHPHPHPHPTPTPTPHPNPNPTPNPNPNPNTNPQVTATVTYDTFQAAMEQWVNAGSGQEQTRRGKIYTGLQQVMMAHRFYDQGVIFSQFQRYLQKPYNPNLRDVYFVLCQASQVAVLDTDVAAICNAAEINPISATPVDNILSGLLGAIANGNLSQLDIELFQAEVDWLIGNRSLMVLEEFLQRTEADPAQDCDSILKNLDSNGVTAFESLMQTAYPSWEPPKLDYTSFDKNLSAWIAYKYTDAASEAVAQQEIVTQVLGLVRTAQQNHVPFPEFQQELLQTESVWGGPILYFSLSKVTTDDSDNLPVPTDALEAIFRCAGLDISGCQPNDIDRIYTELLSHQNGGTPGSRLTDADVVAYGNIIQYITTHQGNTLAEVVAYIDSLLSTVSTYAQQDLQAIINPEQNSRPYYYAEDTEYFRNDQKLLPLHPEDAQYYREHVIPSLGVGKYKDADNVGRYRYVTGKGGEYYFTVHYNQFVRVDQLVAAAQTTGGIAQEDIASWIQDYTQSTSSLYDSHFYKEIQDLAQIAGVTALDLLQLASSSVEQQTQVLASINSVFLTLLANPPPQMPVAKSP